MTSIEYDLKLTHYPFLLLSTVLHLLEQSSEILLNGLEEDLSDDEHSFHVPPRLDQDESLALPVVALLAHSEGLLKWVIDFVDELLYLFAFLA